jgi:hypothetical protein
MIDAALVLVGVEQGLQSGVEIHGGRGTFRRGAAGVKTDF